MSYTGYPPVQPASYEEVEKLVQQLYRPGSPEQVSRVQEALQKLQRSSEGWHFADILLNSLDEKVRGPLDAESTGLVLNRLLLWLVRLVRQAEGALVTRKLCSALTAYYLKPAVSWDRCIKHTVCCFFADDVVAYSDIERYAATSEILPKLNPSQLLALSWLSTGIVEEVGKMHTSNVQTSRYHERIVNDMGDVVALLRHSLQIDSANELLVAIESTKCLQSWALYAHRAYIDRGITFKSLQGITKIAISNLDVKEMFEVTAEFFTDILSTFSAYFTRDDLESLSIFLTKPISVYYVQRMQAGDFDHEVLLFGRLLLHYGDATVQDLAKNVYDLRSRRILEELIDLMQCKGYPTVEDEICTETLEFWATYTEFLIDSLFDPAEDTSLWMNQAKSLVIKVVEASWSKICFPPDSCTAEWDSESLRGFKAFRADVEDLLQSSYMLLGTDLFKHFAQLTLESLHNEAWLPLEAAFFCLDALCDCITDEEAEDEMLSKIFGSPSFRNITNAGVPIRTQQAAVSLLRHYTTYFERHPELLPGALTFLFDSLRTTGLSTVAASAILSLCSSCRKSLVPELEAFLHQYSVLLSWSSIDCVVKEKVVGAIAFIIQALPAEFSKIQPLNVLMQSVESDIHSCLQLDSANHYDEALTKADCAMHCLISIGKALQAPDDSIIDLDRRSPPSPTWLEGPGLLLQHKIYDCFRAIVDQFQQRDGGIVEAACQMLRTGYTESIPGPFVLAPEVTEKFVANSDLLTPCLSSILETAGVMLSKHQTDASAKIAHSALRFLSHILKLITLLGDNPSNDPDIAASCANLAEKLIPRYLDIFTQPEVQESAPKLFVFLLRCMTTAEMHAKRSAAMFWASFVQVRDQPQPIQDVVDSVMMRYGPLLGQALIQSIAGEAARSELEFLVEPLKKMVFRQPNAKMWLEDALLAETFPSVKVSQSDKRIWLQKVMNLRGAKGTNQLVADFWVACRGTNFAYIS